MSQVEETASRQALRGGLACLSNHEEEEIFRGKVEGRKLRERVCGGWVDPAGSFL